MERQEKKRDLRDNMLPPMPSPEEELERKDRLPARPTKNVGDLPLVTPDPTRVPEGQTTHE